MLALFVELEGSSREAFPRVLLPAQLAQVPSYTYPPASSPWTCLRIDLSGKLDERYRPRAAQFVNL